MHRLHSIPPIPWLNKGADVARLGRRSGVGLDRPTDNRRRCRPVDVKMGQETAHHSRRVSRCGLQPDRPGLYKGDCRILGVGSPDG